jgi:integrase
MSGKRRKRTYGTGTYRHRYDATWELKYRPAWAPKPQYRLIEAEKVKEVENQLSDWVKELDQLNRPPVALSIEQLHDLLIADYRRKKRETTADTSRKFKKHLGSYFDRRDLIELESDDVEAYIDARLAIGAANSTINREVSWLHRAFVLARKRKLTKAIFDLDKLDERAGIRQGFISHDEYMAILRLLPAHLQMLWCFAYHWGIRKGELLKLRWEWALPYLADDEPIIKIPGFDARTKQRITKSGDPHTLPLYEEEMRAFLHMALSTRNSDCPYIFQYRGKQLKSPRTGFENARHAAGLDHVNIHDTRRTAIRNMTNAHINKRDAKQISGHKTDSVFDRYDIASEDGAVETGKTMRGYMQVERQKYAEREKLVAKLVAKPTGPVRKGDAVTSGKFLN